MPMPELALSNGVALEPLSGPEGFLGFGRVSVAGQELRCAQRPWFVHIRNPYGVELCHYRLVATEPDGEGLALRFTASARAGGPQDWMLHSVRNAWNTSDWSAAPQPLADTTLTLRLHPVARTIGGRACTGFRYQFAYRSASVPVYKLLDRGTWEPGGTVLGQEFWCRNSYAPAIARFTDAAQHYSTEWYLPTCRNPNIFQFLPFQTQHQGFTFTSGPAGTLLTWATQVAHILSLFEKPRGTELLVHWHEHCGDLAHEFTTAPVEVLWAPGALDRVGRANFYEAARDLVADTLHADAGLRRERVRPLGEIEEWSLPDFDVYTDTALPALLDAGMQSIRVANHFQNNMNVWGVSNMCCTVDYRWADDAGGEAAVRRFCARARAGGATVRMWGNTSISTLSVIFRQRQHEVARLHHLPKEGNIGELLDRTPEALVLNPSGAIEADHYTPVFAVLNLRNPAVREYWRQAWQAAYDAGIGEIFLDSSFNLSSDKFHFVAADQARLPGATSDQVELLGHVRPATPVPARIESQYRAHLDLVAEMQRMGYVYEGEDLGVFGLSATGPSIASRLGHLFLWPECAAGFDVPAIRAAGGEPDAVFFQGLAYRLMFPVYYCVKQRALSFHYWNVRSDDDRPTPWHLALYRAFAAVNDRMVGREILPDEAGVVYRRGDEAVLWAFRDLAFPLARPMVVHDILADTRTPATGTLAAQRHRVYALAPATKVERK